MSVCLMIGVNFDHLVKMDSVTVLHCKDTFFPLCNEYLVRRYFQII